MYIPGRCFYVMCNPKVNGHYKRHGVVKKNMLMFVLVLEKVNLVRKISPDVTGRHACISIQCTNFAIYLPRV